MNKKTLNVIHDDNLELFLISIGAYDDIKKGNKKCKFCKENITFENLHSVFPESGNINFVCDSSDCIKLLSDLLDTGKINS